MKKVYLYKGFERFWHWAQSVLIIMLMITGFEIHGSFQIFGYRDAILIHNTMAWSFMVLMVFAIFWHITTGEWVQYVPTMKNLKAQIEYYLGGIFRNSPHPTGKRLLSKLNPLQRMTYFGLKVILIPLSVLSGLFYMFFHYPVAGIEVASLEIVALAHVAGAYLLVGFLVIHLYLITTGHTVFSNLKAMITGWEELGDDEVNDVLEDVINSAEKIIRTQPKSKKSENKEKIKDMVEELILHNGNQLKK